MCQLREVAGWECFVSSVVRQTVTLLALAGVVSLRYRVKQDSLMGAFK